MAAQTQNCATGAGQDNLKVAATDVATADKDKTHGRTTFQH